LGAGFIEHEHEHEHECECECECGWVGESPRINFSIDKLVAALGINDMMTPETLDELITDPPAKVVEAVSRTEGDILVLGAGGKMGFHFCRMIQRALQSLQRNDDVIAVSRFSSPDAKASFDRHQIPTHSADLSDPLQVAAVPEAGDVFFLAGVKFGTADNSELLHRMNVRVPQLVAERYASSRIVALSTGCVYSFTTPESGGSREGDPTDPPGAYAASCLQREQAFMEASERHGTRTALVRLNYSIDLRYGVLVDLAQKILDEQPVDLTTGYVNVIWQGDAVSQIIRCLDHAASPPWIVNITSPETFQTRELATRFGRRLGKEPKFVGQEEPECWLSNSAQATKLFGTPSVGIDQMIDWIADWLRTGGATLGKPTHFQVRDGNY